MYNTNYIRIFTIEISIKRECGTFCFYSIHKLGKTRSPPCQIPHGTITGAHSLIYSTRSRAPGPGRFDVNKTKYINSEKVTSDINSRRQTAVPIYNIPVQFTVI